MIFFNIFAFSRIAEELKNLSKILFILTPYMWFAGMIVFIIITLTGIWGVYIYGPAKMFKKMGWLFRSLFRVLLIPVTIEYKCKINARRNYIFMPNHASFLDVPLAGASLPVFANAIEAESHFSWPLYGKLIKAFEQIPIDRENPRSSIRSFQIAKERIKNGRSIIVFPEGHRSEDGKLQPFKKLPFKMALECDADIVPVGITGAHRLSPKGSIWVRPAILKIKYGEVITNEQKQKYTIEELIEKVRNEIINLVEDY